VCHALLADIKFHQQLILIDADLAEQTRLCGCPFCGGPLHQADFPRKPRSCPRELRTEFALRFSFCCGQCRRRTTAASVRFLGRRVHLALAVVLVSVRGDASLARQLSVSPRTVQRWRQWWRERFPASCLWQTMCARFMQPVDVAALPGDLLARFGAPGARAMLALLRFLTPLTCAHPITLCAGR
jgi:hypothetical protein